MWCGGQRSLEFQTSPYQQLPAHLLFAGLSILVRWLLLTFSPYPPILTNMTSLPVQMGVCSHLHTFITCVHMCVLKCVHKQVHKYV